jgi:hypothetical protein
MAINQELNTPQELNLLYADHFNPPSFICIHIYRLFEILLKQRPSDIEKPIFASNNRILPYINFCLTYGSVVLFLLLYLNRSLALADAIFLAICTPAFVMLFTGMHQANIVLFADKMAVTKYLPWKQHSVIPTAPLQSYQLLSRSLLNPFGPFSDASSKFVIPYQRLGLHIGSQEEVLVKFSMPAKDLEKLLMALKKLENPPSQLLEPPR